MATRTTSGTVLIVDDDDAVRLLLAEILESNGYVVLQADQAEGAMQIAAANRIDAFLLDIDMPGTGGIALCRMFRERQEYKLTPILFVTGTTNSLADAFAAGGDDLIEKPVDPHVLKARLKGHLQRAVYAQQLSRTRSILNQYVSNRTREVAEAAAQTGILPPPEQREVVILFTDIRGFTAMSEEMIPDRLFALVSNELAVQVHTVYEHGGYVDKFGGDGLMAIFDGEDKVVQSCRCALEIMARPRPDTMEGQRIRQLGIGVHMGPVVVGTIGAVEHFDYSVIGNAVNLAARLCGYAEPMSIIVSKAIRDAAVENSNLCFGAERRVVIRGLREAVAIYALSPAVAPAL